MTTEYTQNFGLALPDFRMGPWHDLVNNDITKIDALLFSALSGQNVDVWANNTIYTQGLTILDDTDASIWMCSIDHTSALTGTFLEDRTAHPRERSQTRAATDARRRLLRNCPVDDLAGRKVDKAKSQVLRALTQATEDVGAVLAVVGVSTWVGVHDALFQGAIDERG